MGDAVQTVFGRLRTRLNRFEDMDVMSFADLRLLYVEPLGWGGTLLPLGSNKRGHVKGDKSDIRCKKKTRILSVFIKPFFCPSSARNGCEHRHVVTYFARKEGHSQHRLMEQLPMNFRIISAALALAMGTTALTASAEDGRITFQGTVTAETCDIDGNNSGGPDFTLTLPKVSTGAFKGTVGNLAGQVPFHIALSGSTCTSTAAKIHLEADNDNGNGDLRNTTAGGSNVAIRITDAANNQINVSTNEGSDWVDIVDGKARLDYRAHYVSTNSATTAGAVNSFIRYSIAYQ